MLWKSPKGTVDIAGNDYERFDALCSIIKREFIHNGGQPLETPVFERTDVLMGKYGEEADTKLIYNIEANGGEDLTLRYDLTVPFVRYVKENAIQKMRRWTIGKVYRRDQPNCTGGRFREFYQADFDILGEDNESMVAECTLLQMACKVLNTLGVDYDVLVNDVNNLKKTLVDDVKVPEHLWKALCPIIDKLDKQPFDALVPQFLQVYADLDVESLRQALSVLEPSCEASKNKWYKLRSLAQVYYFDQRLLYTSSLARGLDYYSGFIWEIKIKGMASSIIAGGRYDTLLGKSLVGISFGVSRMLSLLKDVIDSKNSSQEWKESMFVTTIGDVCVIDRMRVVMWARDQWPDRPILYSFAEKDKKLVKVIDDCIAERRRYIVILAEKEWNSNKEVIIKDLKEHTQESFKYDIKK